MGWDRGQLIVRSMTDALLITAKWVAPMDSAGPELIRDGALVVESGKIVSVGNASELRRRFAVTGEENLGDALILPGLVNAHVHLELSQFPRPAVPGRFVDWVLEVIRGAADAADPDLHATKVAAAVREGVAQSIRFGVTTVGDISRSYNLTRPLLKQTPLRVMSFGEVTGMGKRRAGVEQRVRETVGPAGSGVGISPHAPYSIEIEGYRHCVETSRQLCVPLATHLAETPDEAIFLRDHSGPLREIWEFLGAWDDAVPRFDGGPIRLMESVGLLDCHAALAHVNYCDDAELELLSRKPNASVVYCPRTHAYFGHPSHRWREMLARGINVAVGTDSCASSPDLNLVDDLRLLRRLAPETPVRTIWEMATIRAARALGLDSQVGSLQVGKAADLVSVSVVGDDPLAEVLDTGRAVGGVFIAGRRIGP